jgi:hypothetical protein
MANGHVGCTNQNLNSYRNQNFFFLNSHGIRRHTLRVQTSENELPPLESTSGAPTFLRATSWRPPRHELDDSNTEVKSSLTTMLTRTSSFHFGYHSRSVTLLLPHHLRSRISIAALLACLFRSLHGVTNFSLPTSPSYAALLNSSISNLRFTLPGVGRPVAVVLPGSRDGLRAAVLCARGAALAGRPRAQRRQQLRGALLHHGEPRPLRGDRPREAEPGPRRPGPRPARPWASSTTPWAGPAGPWRSPPGPARPSGWEAPSPAAGSGSWRGSTGSPPTTCWTPPSSTRAAGSSTGARWATTCSRTATSSPSRSQARCWHQSAAQCPRCAGASPRYG